MVDIIKKYKLDKRQWTHKGFHGILHAYFPVGEMPLNIFKKNYGDSFKITVFFVGKDYIDWYWNDEDMIRLRNSAIKKTNKDRFFLKKLLAAWLGKVHKFEKIFKPITAEKLGKLSNKEILSLYKDFYEAYIDEYSLGCCLQDPFSMHADRFLEPAFRKVLGNDFAKYFVLLMSPVTDSFINKAQLDLYRLQQVIAGNKKLLSIFKKNKTEDIAKILEKTFPSFYSKLTSHSQKYHWLQNNYAKVVYLDQRYYIEQLKNLISNKVNPSVEIKKINGDLTQVKQQKAKLIKKLKLSKELKNLISITEVFGFMQDERKKYVLISNYYQKLFRDEISKRTGLSKDQMDYTVYHEMSDLLLKGKVNKKALADRKAYCLCVQTLKGWEVITGPEAKRVYDRVFKIDNKSEKLIKGQSASLGKVVGQVKIIRKTHDMENMQQGDILFASMTRPEMIVAIKKAAGIVTDEGGITCHAAIISRELNIPCIIGTKVGTQVFKDGDIVELDANNGTVRKYK
ncbi:MAG: pyruvate, water dikinase [Candidatus Doudnabacteria bacterium Gr01-1014_77]|uniref:Pyruvate, water dikinase n=1 Tax=Candidatus Doudnabacteria bacterium Gr01-1014_77 TaxID=2017133 RepID=A0A554JA03_9BACT|nr:MAG: pyruvate, water dikinase [Candidatus Doudnabacteria bacterium Gr01-1014_77]